MPAAPLGLEAGVRSQCRELKLLVWWSGLLLLLLSIKDGRQWLYRPIAGQVAGLQLFTTERKTRAPWEFPSASHVISLKYYFNCPIVQWQTITSLQSQQTNIEFTMCFGKCYTSVIYIYISYNCTTKY